jgi:hypothetical protein
MLRQTTATGKPKPKEYHGVLDETAAANGTIGTVLDVFPTAAQARRFSANLSHAAKLARTGARIDLAFHPRVNTSALSDIIATSPNVRPRIVSLKADLPPRTHVLPRLHVKADGPPPGSLRCR